ncbi:centrosomin isoform X2 [Bacillus rossius redtenbacheri]|uniref:centrosomin isoform X2 n=1 Tax=Bacillus rossius redtenbacheri TaxID=93214 RepID=UPI002FDEAAA3
MNDYTPDETAFSTLNITSPSQLQEVTLDPSLSSTVSFAALRSPEKTSPMRGRSVKEFEEMLSQLKKENFNLKLRIYFLEERLGSMSGTDKEQLTREVVELKVELEALRKEKDEKEDLLLQASRLVELTDRQHQEQLQERDQEIKDLRSRLQQLEAAKDDTDLIQFEDSMVAVAEERRLELEKLTEQVRQLEEGVRQERGRAGGLEEACRESRRQAEALQGQLEELSRRLEGREAELQAARDQVDSLKSQVKRSSKLCLSPSKKRHSPEGAEQKVTPLRTQEQQNAVAVQKENEDLTKKLKKLDENYKKSCMTIQSFMKRTTDLAQELEKSRLEGWEKDKHAESLGRQLEAMRVKLAEAGRAKQPAGSAFLAEEEKLWAEIENNNQPVSQLVKDQVMARLELEKQIKSLMESLKQKEHQLSEYENRLASATSVIREKDNKILELQKEIAALKDTVSSLQEDKRSFDKKAREENESEKASVTEGHVSTDELKEELEAKTKEIAKLNVELKKKNNNLQELVNKELWSKNREIEKLQHRVNSICENKDVEIMSLQQEVTARDFQVKVLLDKMADLGVHASLPSALTFRDVFQDPDGADLREQVRSVLEERLYLCQRVGELEDRLRNTPERDDSHLLPLLRGELAKAKEDAARAEVWRCEAVDACAVLTRRLEELARFLNSLLSRGCFLGGLGRKRRQLLKQAVESSMELSRTINMSICGSGAGDSQVNSLSSCLTSLSCNVSLADMWDESWLEDCFEDSSCNPGSPVASPCGVNASHGMSEDDRNVQLIARLRSEVETLKQELIQRNKEMTQAEKEGASTETEPQQQSASLAGKQPELNVSFASITFYNSQHSNAPNCLRDGGNSADLKSPKRLSPRNSKKQAVLPQMDGCAQLRKCDLLNHSNKIRRSSSASAVALSQLQQHDGCLSDSEAWSEPDRNVSLARMGLCEDRAKAASCRSPLRLSLDNSRDLESSDSSDDAAESGEGMRSPGRQGGRVETELLRLRSRMRGLERVNDSLRAELNTFCRWATGHTGGDGACAAGKLDKSTSIECLAEGAVSLQAPSQILEQVCHQREKLEALLLHNDAIRHQMEGIVTVMEGKSGSPTAAAAPAPDSVKGIASQLEEALSRNRQLEQELEAARDGLQEQRNEGLEQQCALLEAQNAGQQACLELEQRLLELETQLGEARLVAELSAQEEELARSRLLQADKNVEEANKRLEQMERMCAERESAAKADAERKLCELEKRADELEVAMEEQRREFERREREAQEVLKVREEEWSRAREALEGQLDVARGRASGLALERTRLDNDKVHLEQALRQQGAREAELLRERRRLEGEVADLKHQLDTQVSALTLQKSELEQEIQQFKAVNSELQQNLSKLRHSEMKQFSSNHSEHNSEQVSGLFLDKASSRSSGLDTGDFSSLDCHSASQVSLPPQLFRQRSEMSDYVSEDQAADECGTVITQLCDRQGNTWVTVSGQQRGALSSQEQALSRVVNASPDLGIESDAGRLSSMEVALAFETAGDQGTPGRDRAGLEQENAELRRRLARTRRTLEETVAQLTAANQRKKLMEKAICRQLCKTHHVLKTTRCHLEAAQDQ